MSRQSVSRWEMDAAFPETEKLIKLSRLLECSIDFLLNGDIQKGSECHTEVSANDCFRFIRECTYFSLQRLWAGSRVLDRWGLSTLMRRRCI